jgi:hypothetical protein
VLLVLGLLAGLFGMHAVSVGGVVAVAAHHGSGHAPRTAMAAATGSMTATATATATAAESASSGIADESVCHGAGNSDGHAHHADATCASGAVGGGPALPVPLPDPVTGAVLADADRRSVPVTPESGRAPPSLAELQLLRI